MLFRLCAMQFMSTGTEGRPAVVAPINLNRSTSGPDDGLFVRVVLKFEILKCLRVHANGR